MRELISFQKTIAVTGKGHISKIVNIIIVLMHVCSECEIIMMHNSTFLILNNYLFASTFFAYEKNYQDFNFYSPI